MGRSLPRENGKTVNVDGSPDQLPHRHSGRNRVVGRIQFVRGDGNEESPLLPKAAVRVRAVKAGLLAEADESRLNELVRFVPQADIVALHL